MGSDALGCHLRGGSSWASLEGMEHPLQAWRDTLEELGVMGLVREPQALAPPAPIPDIRPDIRPRPAPPVAPQPAATPRVRPAYQAPPVPQAGPPP